MQVRISPPHRKPLKELAAVHKRSVPKEVEVAVENHIASFSEDIRESRNRKRK